MGWTYAHRDKGYTDRQWFEKEHGERFKSSLVDCATKGGVFYAVMEVPAAECRYLVPDAKGMVRYCSLDLIKWAPKDHHNFGWKSMGEFAGPYDAQCPAKLLDMLSPFKPEALVVPAKKDTDPDWFKPSAPAGYAAAWREKCRDVLAQSATLRVGQTYLTPGEMRFTDGRSTDRVTLASRQGRKLRWTRSDGMLVKLSQNAIRQLRPLEATGATA